MLCCVTLRCVLSCCSELCYLCGVVWCCVVYRVLWCVVCRFAVLCGVVWCGIATMLFSFVCGVAFVA